MTEPTPILAATSRFTSWDESPGWGPESPLPRVAHAQVTFTYEGDLDATSDCRFVLHYRADGTGAAAGFEMITGTRDGTAGAFVISHDVDFHGDGVTSRFEVVEGSGTGAFAGLSGTGTYRIAHGAESWEWALA